MDGMDGMDGLHMACRCGSAAGGLLVAYVVRPNQVVLQYIEAIFAHFAPTSQQPENE